MSDKNKDKFKHPETGKEYGVMSEKDAKKFVEENGQENKSVTSLGDKLFFAVLWGILAWIISLIISFHVLGWENVFGARLIGFFVGLCMLYSYTDGNERDTGWEMFLISLISALLFAVAATLGVNIGASL